MATDIKRGTRCGTPYVTFGFRSPTTKRYYRATVVRLVNGVKVESIVSSDTGKRVTAETFSRHAPLAAELATALFAA